MTQIAGHLLLLVGLAGCTGLDRDNTNCEWPQEIAMSFEVRGPALQRHLSDDALVAEDLAIRYADSHRGTRSGDFEGFTEYRRTRDECMTALFSTIATSHGVTSERVRESLVRRRTGLDAAVILSFAVLYGFAADRLARRLSRRFPLDDGWSVALLATFVTAVAMSFIGVLLGEQWSVAAEVIRVGNSHLSYRTFRIPWVQHREKLFVGGLFLFWLVAVLRYRACTRATGDPGPEASDSGRSNRGSNGRARSATR